MSPCHVFGNWAIGLIYLLTLGSTSMSTPRNSLNTHSTRQYLMAVDVNHDQIIDLPADDLTVYNAIADSNTLSTRVFNSM